MTSVAESLTRLSAVREAAADPQAAYLIRSRLRRALLTCSRMVAERQELEKPVLPGQWKLSPDAPPEIVEVVWLCRRIYHASEHLCQPSESFDVRWEQGWKEMQQDLTHLNDAIRRLG